MYSDDFFVFAIPLVVFFVMGLAAHAFGKRKSVKGLSVIGGLCGAFGMWMFVGMATAGGYDALGYFFALIWLGAPAAVGSVLGGLVGWLRAPRPQLQP